MEAPLRRSEGRAPAFAEASGDDEISDDSISRTARELVAAYGAEAAGLMRRRILAVRRRGDSASASLWLAVADAIERELLARRSARAKAAVMRVT
ncbi:MAG: hypothetical protein KIT16_07380 [Rhodospirillaceae bacterium]|nr:hypothetical protein [Rhodospirillaceae bacterium]